MTDAANTQAPPKRFDRVLSAYEAMQIAMELERDGFQFYKIAARQARNGRVRAVFQKLAREEMAHLVTIERDILPKFKAGEYDFDDEGQGLGYLLAIKRADIVDTKISPQLAANFPATDVAALDLGIETEQESVVFYRHLAEIVPNPDGKTAFNRLADEEKQHMELLRIERDYFKRLAPTEHSKRGEPQ